MSSTPSKTPCGRDPTLPDQRIGSIYAARASGNSAGPVASCCASPKRCHNEPSDGRNSRGTRKRRGGSVRIGDERLRKGRSAGHHGPGPARLSRHPAEWVLADDGIGVRIIRKADGGRRPKAIWEISVSTSDFTVGADRSLLSAAQTPDTACPTCRIGYSHCESPVMAAGATPSGKFQLRGTDYENMSGH